MEEALSEGLPGRATPEGTQRFATRAEALPGHFRKPDDLTWSSLALGMRRGRPGGVEDLLYRSAVAQCLEGGVNVFNTALSDRNFTSERALGHALHRAIDDGTVTRDEVIVVSKGGELSLDAEALTTGHPQHQFETTYVKSGVLDPATVVSGNCLAPGFLLDQIDRSRRNLGLQTLDVYLVQEPELHLRELGPSAFRDRLGEVFEALEGAAREGIIGVYGVCSWTGLLIPHTERDHLSVMDVFNAALDAGSADHHMRVLQLPYGLAMGEGAALASQLGPDGASHALLEELDGTGTAVLASAPLYGGRLVGRVPKQLREAFPEATSDAQACLQFVRSTPGITSAVVGMSDPDHVDDNLALAKCAPSEPTVIAELFERFAAAR